MNHARQKTGDPLRLCILQGVEVILIMKIVQIVLRMEFESINTSKKHYITVHYKKILRHGALSYRYERLLFFLILFKNKFYILETIARYLPILGFLKPHSIHVALKMGIQLAIPKDQKWPF